MTQKNPKIIKYLSLDGEIYRLIDFQYDRKNIPQYALEISTKDSMGDDCWRPHSFLDNNYYLELLARAEDWTNAQPTQN